MDDAKETHALVTNVIAPGAVLGRTEDGFVVGVADGAVRVIAAPLAGGM